MAFDFGCVEVHYSGGSITRLNEPEYIGGQIYANIRGMEKIAQIDPETGQVTGWIKLRGLLPPEDRGPPLGVLNGIAYDEENGRLFVTGKLWPKLFEIEPVSTE
jgi:glutamine cyclotransferase